MPSKAYTQAQLDKLPTEEQVQILHKALQIQKSNPRQQPFECIAQAIGLPLFPKVQSAVQTAPFQLTLHFNDGKQGTIDFQVFFNPSRPIEAALLNDEALFNQFEVREGTLVWPKHGRTITDLEGKPQFHPYDIDPALLYEHAMGHLI
jgi:hypothetical protein